MAPIMPIIDAAKISLMPSNNMDIGDTNLGISTSSAYFAIVPCPYLSINKQICNGVTFLFPLTIFETSALEHQSTPTSYFGL